MVKSSAEARPILHSPASRIHYQPQDIKPQGGVGNPALERPKSAYQNTARITEYYNRPTENTLLKGDPGFDQFFNRQASFLLNPDAQLDLPPSLIGLLPNTVQPIRAVHTGFESTRPNPQILQSLNPRLKAPSPPFQGVGADFAQPSFTDAQATQNKKEFERFLTNPLLRERPFNQVQRTTKPPNFTPIPVPEVLRPSKLNRLPSGLESALTATTVKPLMVPFEAKYGLKPPSQLSGWFSEMYEPVSKSSNCY